MSIHTVDHAKVGQQVWRVVVWEATDSEVTHREVASAFYDARHTGIAKGFATTRLSKQWRPSDIEHSYWAEVLRGTYIEENLDGILDAHWEPDLDADQGKIGWHVMLMADGEIFWDAV